MNSEIVKIAEDMKKTMAHLWSISLSAVVLPTLLSFARQRSFEDILLIETIAIIIGLIGFMLVFLSFQLSTDERVIMVLDWPSNRKAWLYLIVFTLLPIAAYSTYFFMTLAELSTLKAVFFASSANFSIVTFLSYLVYFNKYQYYHRVAWNSLSEEQQVEWRNRHKNRLRKLKEAEAGLKEASRFADDVIKDIERRNQQQEAEDKAERKRERSVRFRKALGLGTQVFLTKSQKRDADFEAAKHKEVKERLRFLWSPEADGIHARAWRQILAGEVAVRHQEAVERANLYIVDNTKYLVPEGNVDIACAKRIHEQMQENLSDVLIVIHPASKYSIEAETYFKDQHIHAVKPPNLQ
ncbi:MAG: hypothetical protein WBB25_19835 [Sulfitobacter sp.]